MTKVREIEINKIDVGEKSNIVVEWNTLALDYSKEKEDNIRAKMANKYKVPLSSVKVEAKLISKNSKGETVSFSNEIIQNIQDPKFQQTLFKDYITDNGIENCDFEKIIDIDNEINGLIDYNVYEKYRKYSIKWINWSNFLSYGDNNTFNFDELNGLVLLKGIPANQAGKSTLSVDLISFLLYGKTTKSDVLSDVFNRYRPNATEVIVEGCLEIDGEEYIIKRILTRPDIKKRTEKSKVTQKIEYYKLVDGVAIEIGDVDSDNCEGITGTQTNKIIKEAIGNEKDFNLIVSANSDNLKSLISLKDTERGRLLAKWIGLLPLEEKDKLAREKFNKEINPKLMLNKFNRETLTQEIADLKSSNDIDLKKISDNEKLILELEKTLTTQRKSKDNILLAKEKIDDTISRIDIVTLEKSISDIKTKGKAKRATKLELEKELLSCGIIEFSEDEYKKQVKDDKDKSIAISEIKAKILNLTKDIKNLEEGEFCPTCKQKLEGIDNKAVISLKNQEKEELIKNGIRVNIELEVVKKVITELENKRTKLDKKVKLELAISQINVEIATLINDYKEKETLSKSFIENKEKIERNNKLDNELNVINVNIGVNEKQLNTLNTENTSTQSRVDVNLIQIQTRNKTIEIITNEEVLVKNWKTYLLLVGKNGVSKMVLRNTLPIINTELRRLLSGVTDFDVVLEIDDKSDVNFQLLRDGFTSNLSSGSGFEQTCASIALRMVLGEISTMPRPNFIQLDEVLGGIAEENMGYLKLLYDRILKNYSFVLHITHIESIFDWHNTVVTINKTDNVSNILLEDIKK